MIKLELLLGVVAVGLWVSCLVDVGRTDRRRINHLPKWAWLCLVLLFPLVGSLVWLAAGRPQETTPRRLATYERTTADFPEYPGPAAVPGRPVWPDAAPENAFQRQVRARAEEQRRRYAQQQRRQQTGDDSS